jgi:2-iminobutanoate/2-iminopropanoate deaminase
MNTEDFEPIFKSHSADASPEVARYSHVIEPIVPGHPVELSGIVGVDIETKKLVEGGAGPEAECILREIERQLRASRLSLKNVMRVRVMLAGPVSDDFGELSEDFKAMNAAYNKAFAQNSPPPVRDTIGGLELLHHARVEMVATAWRPDSGVKE